MTNPEPERATAVGMAGSADFILLGIPDVNGSIRGKALRPAAFQSAVENGTVVTDLLLALDPVDVPVTDYERFGIRSGAGDMVVCPEPSTKLRELAWRPGWQMCLATPFWLDRAPCELAVREVLRRALADIAELGYEVLAAFEYEVRIYDNDGGPLSTGISYSLAEVFSFADFIRRLERGVGGLGIELSAIHTEAGPGLLELNIAARPGIQAADDAAMLKLAIKEVAASLGLRASFLAKTIPGEEGSGGHVHFSCWRDGENAFAGSAAELPGPLEAAVGGILDHLAGASLLLNPTINSYKRLVPGYFAPANASWGIENRSAAVRVIRSARPELTNPGRAAMWAAGLLFILYTLVQVGLQGVVSRARLQAHSPSVLVFTTQAFAGSRWGKVMAAAVSLSVIATTGVGIALTARIMLGMASWQALPSFLANVSRRFATPVAASILTAVLLLGLIWAYILATSLANVFGDLISVSSWLTIRFYILTAVAMTVFYRRHIFSSPRNILTIGVLPLASTCFSPGCWSGPSSSLPQRRDGP